MSDDLPLRRVPFDFDAYRHRVNNGPCFVCAILEGHVDYPAHILFRDNHTIAFLNRAPTLIGYSIVAPTRHVERVAEDMTLEEYLTLQEAVYRVARAVSVAVPTERVYVLSLGSQQGNPHVHWHVAPLPPGVPYDEQQFHALMAEHGVLDVTPAQQEEIASAVRRQLRN